MVSHLDALIDSIHYPVEEAAVDVLSQSIPSILSLQGRAKPVSVAAHSSLRISPFQRVPSLPGRHSVR